MVPTGMNIIFIVAYTLPGTTIVILDKENILIIMSEDTVNIYPGYKLPCVDRFVKNSFLYLGYGHHGIHPFLLAAYGFRNIFDDPVGMHIIRCIPPLEFLVWSIFIQAEGCLFARGIASVFPVPTVT